MLMMPMCHSSTPSINDFCKAHPKAYCSHAFQGKMFSRKSKVDTGATEFAVLPNGSGEAVGGGGLFPAGRNWQRHPQIGFVKPWCSQCSDMTDDV